MEFRRSGKSPPTPSGPLRLCVLCVFNAFWLGLVSSLVATLSQRLTHEFGKGWELSALRRMIRFSEAFPGLGNCRYTVATLGWSHFKEILPLKDQLQRDFYAEMCRIERWSVRKLREKIDGMLFERTALSKKPAKLAEQELQKLRAEDRLTPDLVFRDPYFLDFLGLKGAFHEKDLERGHEGDGADSRGLVP